MSVASTVIPLCRSVLVPMALTLKTQSSRGFSSLLLRVKNRQLIPRKESYQTTFAYLHGPSNNSEATSIRVSETGKVCNIVWKDGFLAEFHSIWLRHNCHCTQCRHENGQKLYITSAISADTRIEDIFLKGDDLHIVWQDDICHKGIIPLKFVRDHNYNEKTIKKRRQALKTKNPVRIQTVTYEGIKNSTKDYLKWLQQINEDGISIVQNVPLEENMVKAVAELIAPSWTSIYGDVFDVISIPNPHNIAYSTHELDFHMDLVYFQSPPGLQLLHCLKFDDCVEGGKSLFLDVNAVAEEFRVQYPDMFNVLTTIPASFQKVHYDRELPVHLVNQKPHIKLNHHGDIIAVHWAPGFEGPLAVAGEDVEKYYKAYEMFAKAIKTSPHQLKHRLQPGDLVVFNNLRILHSREGFDLNGGSRHLQGCYINIDMFKSKSQVANILYGDGRLVKRVGNDCWY